MIVVQGTIPVKPARRDDALAAAEEMMAASQAEPGCISYEFFVGVADPNTLMLLQEWDSVEALQDHYRSNHTEVFLRRLMDFLDGKVSTRRYAVVEDDDETVDSDSDAGVDEAWEEDDRALDGPGDSGPRIIH